MDYGGLLAQFGGVVSTKQLKRLGETKESIDEAIACNGLVRERWGWYSTPHADAAVTAAVRAGGVLSCASALRHHGLWVPTSEVVHFRTSRHHRRELGTDVGCRRYGRPTPLRGAVDDVATSLCHAAHCLSPESFVVVCDSALNKRLLTRRSLAVLLSDAPAHVRELIAKCDGAAESGTETMVRLRLRSARIQVTTQFPVPGVGRVDLRVGRRLLIEVDSREHHTGEERYEADRRRDRRLLAMGFLVVRLTYAQVVHTWADSFADIETMIRQNLHR